MSGDIREIWRCWQAPLSEGERRMVLDGVWRRVRRHRIAVRVRYAATTALAFVVVLLTVFVARPTQKGDGSEFELLSTAELMRRVAAYASLGALTELAGDDADSMLAAIIAEADAREALEALPPQEQEEFLLALAEASISVDKQGGVR